MKSFPFIFTLSLFIFSCQGENKDYSKSDSSATPKENVIEENKVAESDSIDSGSINSDNKDFVYYGTRDPFIDSLNFYFSSKRKTAAYYSRNLNPGNFHPNWGPIGSADLEEINSKFTFRNTLIEPRIIFELAPWVSDSESTVVKINLSGAMFSNRFFAYTEPYISHIYDDGAWKVTSDEGDDYQSRFENTISYAWHGMLNNGIHVVRVVS